MTNLPVSSLQIPSGGSLILVVQRSTTLTEVMTRDPISGEEFGLHVFAWLLLNLCQQLEVINLSTTCSRFRDVHISGKGPSRN